MKCAHCKKPGNTVEKCVTKFPALRHYNSQRQNNSNTQKPNNGAKRYCKFFEKDGHTEDKCCTWGKVERNLKAATPRINEIYDYNQGNSDHSLT